MVLLSANSDRSGNFFFISYVNLFCCIRSQEIFVDSKSMVKIMYFENLYVYGSLKLNK